MHTSAKLSDTSCCSIRNVSPTHAQPHVSTAYWTPLFEMISEPPDLHVAGVPVFFPHIPYRAQNALMHAVVTSARKRCHALIESPTGTGKSLALLCSSLAVQKALQKEHNERLPSSSQLNSATFDVLSQENTKSEVMSRPSTIPISSPPSSAVPYSNPENSDDSDFAPRKKFRDVSWQRPPRKETHAISVSQEQPANAFMFQHLLEIQRENPLDRPDELLSQEERNEKKACKVPRIFYATRTHNQVAQVISELRKTVYRPRISILASRREYCIREEVQKLPGRDEICKGLVKESDCQFYFQAAELASHNELEDEAWDIEELNNLGKRHGGCPYYASHELYQNAQLILCPYSFLVDPIVRRARGIDISGDIIILDEAHNIENYARDSASFDADVADMRTAVEEVDTAILTGALSSANPDLASAYRRMKALLEAFMNLVDDIVVNDQFQQHNQYENVIFERDRLLESLGRVEVTSDEVKYWRAAVEYISNYGDGKEKMRKKKMGEDRPLIEMSPQKKPRKKIDACSECRNSNDGDDGPVQPNGASSGNEFGYGCNLNRKVGGLNMEMPQEGPRQRRGWQSGGKGKRGRRRRRWGSDTPSNERPWIAKCMTMCNALLTTLGYLFENPDDFAMVVDRRTVDFVTTVKIQLHCLNAAVCFREISSKARSVIVASGTLTPIGSFAGELGTSFAISKSLPHIIDVRKQLYVGVVSHGPRNVLFDATFKGSSKFDFQDALGDALHDYCKISPGGILIFLPSYRMLEQLQRRWQSSGAWARLESLKGTVLVEPSQRGAEFDELVSAYKEASKSEKGGILFGVCRGKLSEGVDFRDGMSRTVVLIGIPFPYAGDVVVNRKRCWNDRTRLEKDRKELQTGGQWYEMQAFRALNQALGRAVRHRYDYGAILLIDCRFRMKHVLEQLPMWVRAGVQQSNGRHSVLLQGLNEFFGNVQDKVASIAAEDVRNKRGS